MLDLNKSDEELRDDVANAENENQKHDRFTYIVIGIVALVIVIGITGGILIYQRQAADKAASIERMDNNPTTAIGVISDQYTLKTWKNGVKTYVVSYTFEVDNHPYHGSCEIVKLPENPRTVVHYDPQNPEINKLPHQAAETQGETNNSSDKWITTAITMIILSFILGGWKKWQSKSA